MFDNYYILLFLLFFSCNNQANRSRTAVLYYNVDTFLWEFDPKYDQKSQSQNVSLAMIHFFVPISFYNIPQGTYRVWALLFISLLLEQW